MGQIRHATHNTCSEEPRNDRHRQRHDIAYDPREVAQKKEVPDNSTDQRQRIEGSDPAIVSEARRMLFRTHQWGSGYPSWI
jgi:hypothetical protein